MSLVINVMAIVSMEIGDDGSVHASDGAEIGMGETVTEMKIPTSSELPAPLIKNMLLKKADIESTEVCTHACRLGCCLQMSR